MKALKLVLIVVVLVIVALALGYGWGASGRATAQQAVDEVKQQLDLADARAHILDARVSLYNVNFGDAQRQLDDARAPLTRAHDRALAEKKQGPADALSAALGHVQDAQRLAGRLDQNANSQANEALKSIQTATSK
jgi:hypothetical protein